MTDEVSFNPILWNKIR